MAAKEGLVSRVSFPQRIKRGSSVVTLYRTPNRGHVAFTLVFYDPRSGKRCRQCFSDYTRAREAAEGTVASLAGGEPEVLVLRGRDLLGYRRAIEILGPTGEDLEVAARQFAEARALLGSSSLLEALRAVASAKPEALELKTVPEVVRELLEAKRSKGRSELYLRDLKVRLERVARAFPGPLAELTHERIDGFLVQMQAGPRSKNNFRRVIGTLLRFGQVRGYVAKDHPGISFVEKATQTEGEVVVFKPEEMRQLLTCAGPELVPALALCGFAGIRPEEVKRLGWESIHLEQGHIEIRAAMAKTKVRRLIPIPENLRAWLQPHRKPSGPVQPFSNLCNQFLKLARRIRIPWKRNGLRHSFISYRVALTRDVASVAIEAGNSPAIISRNYLKCVTAEEAGRWFEIRPT